MIRKSVSRFSLATNAERVCAEIMRNQRAKARRRFNLTPSRFSPVDLYRTTRAQPECQLSEIHRPNDLAGQIAVVDPRRTPMPHSIGAALVQRPLCGVAPDGSKVGAGLRSLGEMKKITVSVHPRR